MTVLETVLAERMGVPRKVLREKRGAAPAGAWGTTGAGIHWTQAGLAWLEANFGREANLAEETRVVSDETENGALVEAGATDDADAANDARIGVTVESPPSPPLPLMADVTVRLVYEKNRRLLQGELEDGTRVRVKVRDNVNFVKGMVIPCIHQTLDLWTLNGRLPQRRGRLYLKKR